MQRFLLILLTLCSQISYSQKIEEKSFDKFDSIYTISAKSETLVGKILGNKFLSSQIFYHSFKKAEFINSPGAKYFEVLILFKTDISTTTDNETKIKVEFADGTFGTYARPAAKSEIVTDIGAFSFQISLNDKLFKTDIKTIRISTSDANIDYNIPAKKASYIRKALILVKTESEKTF